jgi:cation diffusion facilitator family transporter
MINWLIHKFIKDFDNLKNPSVHTAYGKLSSTVGICCNFVLFLGKITIGLFTGSVSITADAVNNLSDASSSIISLLGFKMASKPADSEHPYGHGRYEYLSGLMVSVLIMVIGVNLLQGSFQKLLHPTLVEFTWITVLILLLSILVKLWMAHFNKRIGNLIQSQTLLATAADSRNDVISTAAVLTAAVISHFAKIELDGWMGFGVACFILYSGFGLIKDTLNPLLGGAPNPALVEQVKEKVLEYPGVLGTHDLMIHDYGPGRQFASVHVEMAAEADVLESHDVIDNIERDFLQQLGLHLIVHYDPIITESSAANDIRIWISEHVQQINPQFSIHDLRIVPGVTHTNVIFDCVVPMDCNVKEAELKEQINRMVAESYPDYCCVITIDRNYAAFPH